MNNKVKFLRGTSNEYAVAEKDNDTIYFTTDDGKLYIGDKEVSGSDITIDDTLSDTSTNPVQNKVVKQAIDNKADKTVATTSADGLMSAEDKGKLDSADDTYALKSKYGDTTINLGRKAGTTVGAYSTAEGRATTASGDCSHAEGYDTTASGNDSHAEGRATTAIGNESHAEGRATTASGIDSHAEGSDTTASGSYSHAEGRDTTASGDYTHAEGYGTTASGSYSHAGGICTKALHKYEVAYGKYNESNDNTLFSVGDGTADANRHNAFEITTTGGKLHDKDIATTDLIPTSLPANGGNADTLSSKSIDYFMHWRNEIIVNPDDVTDIGIYQWATPTTNTNNPIAYGTLIVSNAFGYKCQIAIGTDTSVYIRHKTYDQEWSAWRNVSDGGNADTLDGMHANEIISNPNLLINPDFKINQRGGSNYSTDWVYTVDRWISFGAVVSPNSSGGINISKRDEASYYGFIQRTEILQSDCNGKSMTLSVKINGEVLSGTVIRTDEEQSFFNIGDSSDRFVISSYSNNDIKYILIQLYGSKSYNIEWVKLEYGSVATPFIPPDHTLELIKCHRFYYRARSTTSTFLTGYCVDPGRADVSIPLFMRTNPTVDYNGIVVMCKDKTKPNDTGSRGYTITSAKGFRCNFGTLIAFTVDTSSATMSAGCAVTLQATLPGEYGGYFALDAEIY